MRVPAHMAAHPAGDPAFRSQPPDGMYQAPGPSYPSPGPSYPSPAPSYTSPAPSYASPAPSYASPAAAVGSYVGPDFGPYQPDGGQVSISGVHGVPGSPHTLHRTVATNTPPSPALQRRALNQGSPAMGRRPSGPQAPSGSPGLERHVAYGGYVTPDDRHASLSRQSSASGYQAPATPSFPISPAAAYADGPGVRQGSPAPQPQLPEKRRMSSGERPNGVLAYNTLNGKPATPVSSGGSTPSAAFSHTLPDFSKLSVCGKSPPCSTFTVDLCLCS